MPRRRTHLAAVGVCLCLLTACGLVRGEPDRTETFDVPGGECTAEWWLDPRADEVPAEATEAAERALEESTVSESDLEAWKATLVESDSSDETPPADELAGHAYVEAVREDVREGLAAAGYPDSPTRVVETRADLDCA